MPNTWSKIATITLWIFVRNCPLLCWVLLGMLPVVLSAQVPESKIALLRIFNDSKQADTLRLKAGTALQLIYVRTNLDSLLHLSKQMEQYGIRKRNTLWLGNAWRGYGNVHLLGGRLDSAKYAYLHAKNLCVKRDDAFYPRVLFSLGNLYYFQGNVDSAQYYYLKAIPWSERYAEPDLSATIHLNLGTIYQNLTQQTKALHHYEKAKKNADVGSQVTIETNISTIFEGFGMYEEAEKHSREALRLAQKMNQPVPLALAYCSMIACTDADVPTMQRWVDEGLSLAQGAGVQNIYGRILTTAGYRFLYAAKRPDLAEQYLKRAITEAEKTQEVDNQTRSKVDLAYLYLQQKKYNQALQLCREVKPLMGFDRGLVFYSEYLQVASDAFAGLGRVDSAYHYLKRLDLWRKKEEDISMNRSIMLSYLDYQQKQEKEALIKQRAAAEALTVEIKKRQRSTFLAFGLLSLSLASVAGFFFWYFRERSRTAAKLSLQNEALQKANERLRSFSGVVSHDILSNLDLILTAGKILVGNQPKKEPLTQYYDIAQRTSQQLKAYCLGLLEEARSAVGPIGKMSNPMPIVQELLARQEIALLNKGCRVELSPLSPSLLPTSIVEQVFQNLISNAIRYSLDTPKPLLHIAEEKNPIRGTSYWIVEDNGPGIPPALREAIFDKTTTEGVASQGQNLGLGLLRETLKSYGAKIWVEGRVGGGARFVVELKE